MKNRLKQLREERHLSQEKLASKVGLTGSSICFFETGKRASLSNMGEDSIVLRRVCSLLTGV